MTITTSTAPLSEMLAALDMAPDTRLSWLILRDGQPNRSGVGSVADLTARQWPVDADCYVGLNPLSAPVATGSRGKADDIAQLSTLVLDLDERRPPQAGGARRPGRPGSHRRHVRPARYPPRRRHRLGPRLAADLGRR
ncbi:MAG: hypothetical protein V9E98_02045 [Candidatus Nanopelagicales bacterium]